MIEGTVRCFSEAALNNVEARMEKISTDLCSAFNCGAQFEFKRAYPATINHQQQAQYVRAVATELLGEDQVTQFTPTMGSEDFSFFLQAKPGCYFAIGNGDGDHRDIGHGLGPCSRDNPGEAGNGTPIALGESSGVNIVLNQ